MTTGSRTPRGHLRTPRHTHGDPCTPREGWRELVKRVQGLLWGRVATRGRSVGTLLPHGSGVRGQGWPLGPPPLTPKSLKWRRAEVGWLWAHCPPARLAYPAARPEDAQGWFWKALWTGRGRSCAWRPALRGLAGPEGVNPGGASRAVPRGPVLGGVCGKPSCWQGLLVPSRTGVSHPKGQHRA